MSRPWEERTLNDFGHTCGLRAELCARSSVCASLASHGLTFVSDLAGGGGGGGRALKIESYKRGRGGTLSWFIQKEPN